MNYYKKIFTLCLVCMLSGWAMAQNNTNSPYTMYGFGKLSNHANISERGMGGIVYGMRDFGHTNFANPASYTAIDSLMFIYESGVTLQNVRFNNTNEKLNARNSSLDYLTMHFRAKPWMAFSLGLLPYSNIGYNFGSMEGSNTNAAVYEYSGTGGLHQIYFGAGFKVLPQLSLGVNLAYLWGDMDRNVFQKYATADIYNLTKLTSISVSSYNITLGAQYEQKWKKHQLVLGMVLSPQHRIAKNTNSLVSMGLSGSQLNVRNADSYLPTTVGAGVVYKYDGKWTAGADLEYQNWANQKYMGEKNMLCDSYRMAVGAQYYPNPLGMDYFSHIRYRLGGFYSKPYYKIDGKRAIDEMGVTIGLGLPVPRTRCMISLAGEYAHTNTHSGKFVGENIFRLSVGLTFNQNWFIKNRVE